MCAVIVLAHFCSCSWAVRHCIRLLCKKECTFISLEGWWACRSLSLLREKSLQIIYHRVCSQKSPNCKCVGRKPMLNSAGGKMKADVWEGSPFYILTLNCPSLGTPIINVLRYVIMLFLPSVNWMGSRLTRIPLGEFCNMFIVIIIRLSPVTGVQAVLVQPWFHVNVSCSWLLGCCVYVLSLKYIFHEKLISGL